MADAGDRPAPSTERKMLGHGSAQPRPQPPHSSQHAPRNYKTLYDKDLGAKETIRRYNGHIPGHPKYDVKLPLSDPRNHYVQFRSIPQADLIVPSFTVDRNTLFYPKVEVALFKLNDNVNKAFLHNLAIKIAKPVDLEVFYHPHTKKHMGMAMIVFTTYADSHKFVREYNGRSVMGGHVSCCHDPYFALLSQRYEDATGEEMRIPVHLKHLEETLLNTRRSQLSSKINRSQRTNFTPLPTIRPTEPAYEDDTEAYSPSVSTVQPTPRYMEKITEARTPVSDSSSSRRRDQPTPRPRTPEIEPPPPPPPPPPPTSVLAAPAVSAPLNTFMPPTHQSAVPAFHADHRPGGNQGSHTFSKDDRKNEEHNLMPSENVNNTTNIDDTYALHPCSYYVDASPSVCYPSGACSVPCYTVSAHPIVPTPAHSSHGYAGFSSRRQPTKYRRSSYFASDDRYCNRRFKTRRPFKDSHVMRHLEACDGRREKAHQDEEEKSSGKRYQIDRGRHRERPFGRCYRRGHYPDRGQFEMRFRHKSSPKYSCKASCRRLDSGGRKSSPGRTGLKRHLSESSPNSPATKRSRLDSETCADYAPPHLPPGPSAAVPPLPPLGSSFVGLDYPPPPPYSELPPTGSANLPQNCSHMPAPQSSRNVPSSSKEGETTPSQLNQTPSESYRGRDGRPKSKKKKKKRKRRSSNSSSSESSSSSSLNVGEYLRVEKKEMSTKYISREREGREKTIVEEIKTVTKRKKYRVTESKKSDVKLTPGLQKISSDESSEHLENEEDIKKKEKKTDTSAKGHEKEKKVDVHRWSSSSTDSDGGKSRKKEKKNERLSASSSLHDLSTQSSSGVVAPPPPPPPSVYMSSSAGVTPSPHLLSGVSPSVMTPAQMVGVPGPSVGYMPTIMPHPHFSMPPVNPAFMGTPVFNPLLPPPVFCHVQQQVRPYRDYPKVSLRFVEDPPTTTAGANTKSQQTLADRVASIFGNTSALCPSPSKSMSQQAASNEVDLDDLDDMDVDVGSSISPPAAEASTSQSPSEVAPFRKKDERKRRKGSEASRLKRRFLKNVNVVREATEKVIGEEIVDVITKDFYKRIEGVSFEILEGVLAEIRRELEEQKRNEAQQALRAQAQIVTPEKPSDVSQLCTPFAANLDGAPEKLGYFPFTINMPKLPSFKRKVRPPSPESESSRSPIRRRDSDSDSDHSDAAQKSSSSDHASDSESSDEVVVKKKKQSLRYTSASDSGTESSSELSSSEEDRVRSKSPKSVVPAQKRISSGGTSPASTASSIASSSESYSPSDTEDRDASSVTEDASLAAEVPVKEKLEKELEVKEVEEVKLPLWQRILNASSLEWSESLPRSLYHSNLTEHCYFKLIDDEIQQEDGKLQEKALEIKAVVTQKQKRLSRRDRELLRLLPEVKVPPPPKPQIIYPPWSIEDRTRNILSWDCCFDPEDQEYLKQALLALQPSGENASLPPWQKVLRFNFSSWVNKPRLLDQPIKRGRVDQFFADSELDGIVPIENGCARTRGYFKMSAKEKRRLIRRPEDEQCDKTVINERDEAAVRHNLVVTKESRSMHRRLLTTMGDTNTDFFKVNQLKYRKKMIKFARSRIHGWGLYAMESIAPDDMIVEYVGQKVRNTVADVREKAYERRGIGSSYLFRIDDTTVIDATRMGNFARFINHSCQPNCYAKVVTVDGDKRIVIYSKTLINKGDEITYDYKFPIEDDKVDCLCGSSNCRGYLN